MAGGTWEDLGTEHVTRRRPRKRQVHRFRKERCAEGTERRAVGEKGRDPGDTGLVAEARSLQVFGDMASLTFPSAKSYGPHRPQT